MRKICIRGYPQLTDLTGISHFTSMQYLFICDCSGIQKADVSGCSKLVQLVTEYDPLLTEITGLEDLTQLDAVSIVITGMKHLDLSANKTLTWVSVHDNKLRTIDLTQCPNLLYFDCRNNEITTLNLKQNRKLRCLYCGNNWLTELDLNNNCDLETQRVKYGQLITTYASNTYYCCQIWDIGYDVQTRDVIAEAALVPMVQNGELVKDDKGNVVKQYVYYFRIPKDGDSFNEKSIIDRISQSNVESEDNTTSAFDYSLTSNWTGATFLSGTMSRVIRRAGTVDNIDASHVVGDILVLEPTEENPVTGEASGTVTYSYDVHYNGIVNQGANAPTGTFTINWRTADEVITAIDEINLPANAIQTTYYDLAGRASSKPWQGVNIVVTRLDNGDTTTEKRIY